MNKPTFTKGPWTVKPRRDDYSIEGDGERIASVDNWENAYPKGNARLIASAPELFAQCKFLEKVLASGDLSATEEGLRNCDTLAKLRELLAKVEGEE